MKLQFTLTCLRRRHAEALAMPGDACVRLVHDCPACHARLTPETGDCCVFCSSPE